VSTPAPLSARRRFLWLLPIIVVLPIVVVPSVIDGHVVSGRDMTTSLIFRVLSAPLAYAVPAWLPLAKLLLVVVAVIAVAGTARSPRILVAYYAVALCVVGLLQNAAYLDGQLAFLTGNAVAEIALAAACLVALWKVAPVASPLRRGRLWVLPLMALAAAFPFDRVDGHVAPGLGGIFTGGAGMTYCMITAVLAGAMLVRPDAYPGWLRVWVGSLGTAFGLINLATWFILSPANWWMGVLHFPLLLCSVALTATSWSDARRR
jgi:hypothetical protein